MIMSWIKVDTSLSDKPEVVRIARVLKIKRSEAIGACVMVWIIADSISEEGMLRDYTVDELDELVGRKGFGRAYCDVGWAEQVADGIVLCNFSRNNGQSAKQRAMQSSAMRKRRGGGEVKASPNVHQCEVKASPNVHKCEVKSSPNVHQGEVQTSQRLQQEEEEEYKKYTTCTKKRSERTYTAVNLEEVLGEVQKLGADVSVGSAFYDHYAAAGWIDGAGRPIADWRAKLSAWMRREDEGRIPNARREGVKNGAPVSSPVIHNTDCGID